MSKDELREMLNSAMADLLAFTATFSDDDWNTRTGTEDGWTVRETLGHLASTEPGNLYIAKQIQLGNDIYRPDFDLARFNRRNIEKTASLSVVDHIAALHAAREETIAFLHEIPDEDLAKSGRRTTGEETTVGGMLEIIAKHQRSHLDELHEALGR